MRLRGSQLFVPLDVAHETLLEWKLRLVAEQLARLVDRKRAALGHQRIARAMFDLDAGKMLAHDLGHLVESARAAVGQVEYLVPRFFPGDHQRDPRDEILDVGEIERVAAVAVDRQVLSAQRVLDECLPYAAADAALAVERGGTHDGIRQAENLVVGDHQLLAAELERAVDAQRLALPLLRDRLAFEIAVDHGGREKDEVRLSLA